VAPERTRRRTRQLDEFVWFDRTRAAAPRGGVEVTVTSAKPFDYQVIAGPMEVL
jgi:hypothetical protein